MQTDDPWQHWFKQRRSSNYREWREPAPSWRPDLGFWLDVAAIALAAIAICVRFV